MSLVGNNFPITFFFYFFYFEIKLKIALLFENNCFNIIKLI